MTSFALPYVCHLQLHQARVMIHNLWRFLSACFLNFFNNFILDSNILWSLLKVEMDFPDFFCLARKSFMPSTFEDQARKRGKNKRQIIIFKYFGVQDIIYNFCNIFKHPNWWKLQEASLYRKVAKKILLYLTVRRLLAIDCGSKWKIIFMKNKFFSVLKMIEVFLKTALLKAEFNQLLIVIA